MAQNRIRVLRAEAKISGEALAEKMPDGINKILMSYIERGYVLPTRESLEAMCSVFGCTPENIYDTRDIDLLAVKNEAIGQQPVEVPTTAKITSNARKESGHIIQPVEPTKRHEGMEQIRVWIPVEEKDALFKAVAGLGYHSVAEWFREKYRATLHEYIALQLQGKTIHDSITPTAKIKSSEVVN